MNAFKTLFLTELKLSWRGLDMVIFALALPVVVMVLIGLLYGQQAAFAGAEHTFVEQSFGAVSTIAICAGGLMGLPLSQGIKLLKAAFLGLPLENGGLAALVLIGLSIVCLAAAIKFFRWE